MDTSKARSVDRGDPGSSDYDAFLSYSHDTDSVVAPRLQVGLQRFAKPWWKRQVLRVFRDEASLSANPHLWSSITDAMNGSGWMVLLLSPEAAESRWVNQEVEYWLEHRDPSRILPVVTDGDFTWSDGDFVSDAAPPALHGAFAEEPRWVDLRFARTDEQLDLKNPRFSAAVADLASAIRGVPKDELESEEVRQHRTTVRTAWTAAIALVLLLVVAVGAALFALDQRNEAEAAAEAEAEQRVEAEAAREAEAEQRRVAEDNAQVAKSRELAAAAVSVLGDDPELSILLALESVAATPSGTTASPAGVLALRDAMQENRLLYRYPVSGIVNSARISPDGTTIFHASGSDRAVTALDVATGEPLWTYHDPATVDLFVQIRVSPDGQFVAVSVVDGPFVEDGSVAVDAHGNDQYPARVVVLDTADGRVVTFVETGACPFANQDSSGFSPDGRWMAVWTGTEACGDGGADDWVAVFDTTTWEETHRLSVDGGSYETADFSSDPSRILISTCPDCGPVGATELRSFPDLGLINSLGISRSVALSPDGQHVVRTPVDDAPAGSSAPVLENGETGERINALDAVTDLLPDASFDPLSFSPEGSMIAVATFGPDYVFDAATGRLLVTLTHQAETLGHSFTSDGSMLLTVTPTDLLVWDLGGGIEGIGRTIQAPGMDPVWINPNHVLDGPRLAIKLLVPDPFEEGGMQLTAAVLDPATGNATDDAYGLGVQMPDGRFVLVQSTPLEEDRDWLSGPIVVWDPATDSKTAVTDCTARQSALDSNEDVACPGDESFYGWTPGGLVASADGAFFAAQSYDTSSVRVWDSETLEIRSGFGIGEYQSLVAADGNWISVFDGQGSIIVHEVDTGAVLTELGTETRLSPRSALDSEGALLFVADEMGGMSVFDTSTWETVSAWEAHDAFVRGLALSPDRTRLITTGDDNYVKVWNIAGIRDRSSDTGPLPLLDRIPAPKPSDAAWLSPDRLAVFLAEGAKWLEVSLSTEQLVQDAQQRLTRGFTQGECATYDIDPCPTLEDIRAGDA